MNSLLKTVVLWLMLLALPLQGFAVSAMACCDPQMQAHEQMAMQPMADGTDASHDSDDLREAMDGTDSMPTHDGHMPVDADAAGQPSIEANDAMRHVELRDSTPMSTPMSTVTPTHDHHSGPASTACAACAAHCAGMAPMPIATTVAGHLAPTSTAIPFRPTASTAFVPGTPERPPQPLPV